MKTEINLRSKEFAIAKEFYWPRVLTTLTVIVLLATLAGGTLFLYLYEVNLESEISAMASKKDELEIKVKPVEQIEADIRSMKARSTLKIDLQKQVVPWSAYMAEIDAVAVAGGINIETLNCPTNGQVSIRGWSRSMRRVAAYTQELEELEFLQGVRFTNMNTSEDRINFDITAPILDGGSS